MMRHHRTRRFSKRLIVRQVPTTAAELFLLGLTKDDVYCTIVLVKIVTDTCILLAVALDEPEKPRLIELTEGHDLIAPSVLPFEVGNALSTMCRRELLSDDESLAVWDTIQLIPIEFRSIDVRSALRIAIEHKIYAYDAYFL